MPGLRSTCLDPAGSISIHPAASSAIVDDLNVFCLMLLLDLTIVGGKLVC
jgi:hypothetical protein